MSTSTEQKHVPFDPVLACFKYSLYTFNIFFVAAGIILLLYASNAIVNDHDFVPLLSSSTYPAIAYLMVVTGCLVIIFAVFGCCALIKNHLPILLSFIFMMVFIFLMQAMTGIVAYIYKDAVRNEMDWNLNSTFKQNYYFDAHKTQAIDLLQQKYKCCGVYTFEEWYWSRWRLEHQAGINYVPDSCCKSVTEHCGKSYHPSNIFYAGCITSFVSEIEYQLNYLGGISLGVSLLNIVGILLAVFYYTRRKDKYFQGT